MLPAIALVPGFFGFDHRESQTYFADRFIAGLRAGLEARGIRRIPVVAVSTLGIASLHRRQVDLIHELRALETPTNDNARLGGPRAWHLVGHSTGGVDAALLLRAHPLAKGPEGSITSGQSWGPWNDLVSRVRSVTSIAAPHFGTALAESALARLSAGEPSFAALRDIAAATLDLARRGDLESRVSFAFSAMPGVTQMPIFFAQMILQNELARDLRPKIMSKLAESPLRDDMHERVFSVVTVAPRPPKNHKDKLFRDMWRWTHAGAQKLQVAASPNAGTLDDPALRLPSQCHIALPPIEDGDNDGVVSSTRQLLGKPIAVVVGDHVDVLGRYRRTSLVDDKVIDPGLLTSGAEFDDDEFFALLDRVAEQIAKTIHLEALA